MHFSFTFRMQIGLFVGKGLSSSHAIAEGVNWGENAFFMQFIVCLKGSMHTIKSVMRETARSW